MLIAMNSTHIPTHMYAHEMSNGNVQFQPKRANSFIANDNTILPYDEKDVEIYFKHVQQRSI